MSTKQYKVKQGDTLGAIAKELGVDVGDISGYRSGNPDLIYAGENLSVGNNAKNASAGMMYPGSSLPSYSSMLLGSQAPSPKSTGNTGYQSTPQDFFGLDNQSEGAIHTGQSGIREMLDPTGQWRPVDQAGGETYQKNAGAFDVPGFTQEVAGSTPQTSSQYQQDTPTQDSQYGQYEAQRDKAYKDLEGLRTKEYERAYKDLGLEKIKENVSRLDLDIQAIRDARDESLYKTRSNPYLSASALTGDVSRIADKYNSQINNMLQQRNALAGQYNTGLGEIKTSVENTLADKSMELQYWNTLIEQQQASEAAQQKALMDELMFNTKNDQFDRNLEQQLLLAQMRGSSDGSPQSYKYVTDPYTGQITQWIDPVNRQIIDATAQPNAPTKDEVMAGFTPAQQDQYELLVTSGVDAAEARARVLNSGEQVEDSEGWWQKLKGLFN